MPPEQQARRLIDQRLTQAGWVVQDYLDINPAAARGVAVREFPLRSGLADYLLYADGKVIGVVEAKKDGHTLIGVEPQSEKYTAGLIATLPHHRRPLPFSYESTGDATRFTNHLDPAPRSREVFTFHRPDELLRLVGLDAQLRARLGALPELNAAGMWAAQVETVRHLERSLAQGRPRSLIRMATGSWKTFTAVSFLYRLIKFAGARRVLFLVDRTNLGKQTLKEFQQYRGAYTNYTFTEEYPVQHLRTTKIDRTAKVTITTIQRLYATLKGDPEFAEENEERSMFEAGSPLAKEPLPVVYNETFPPEFFDFIVIDECHRSIYNVWRQVLEYFDAFLIGLTATPTGQTAGFFQGNVVQDYNQERAIADGVNVGFQVYRIDTEVTKNGATIKETPGLFVPWRDRRTLKKRQTELTEDLTYTGKQLDRDVVNLDQIRLVVRTFRDRMPEIFPGRNEVPKTLIFAKTDLHAEDVVEIVRTEFGKPPQEEPWTSKLWVYDLRTNMHFTLKTNPLTAADLDEFVACYRPENRHARQPTWGAEKNPDGRWRAFDYAEIAKRDKTNLDIFWLRDKSLEESEDLPEPDVLAQEIADDLQTALEQFQALASKLRA